MIQKNNKYIILEEFFDYPRKDFQVREISRKTRIAQPSVTNHLKTLLNEKLILKEKKGIYPAFRANRENESFKTYKKTNMILRIHQSGLADYIYDNCLPNTIILFGSAALGEDTEESDIDLFVQSPEKKLNLDKYEKMLKRKISLFFEEKFTKLNNELKNNIINGISINGFVEVFK
jgi:predicted nucleotidyltransferase/DNA-binding transcriptional ArsR family regulator